jgi:signal transduction protein with GAF and PtsI domain
MTEEKNTNLQLELTPDVADGVYANLAVIAHSSSEFVIDFVSVMPGMTKAYVKSRIIMTPEHAKRLLAALQDNIAKYETHYGPIKISGLESKVPPIMGFGGDA